jgi:P4 family phage/plasmid primase-like protien
MSDFKYFKETQAILKNVNQVTEMDKFLQTGHINHSIVASIFYEGFNWKYQYSNGYWYRLSTGGIFQKLSKDAEVHLAKEMKGYLQCFLNDVIQGTTDEDKRKKLWAAQGMIESNSFKMGCVAEAKQDFMNENLYRDLDSKIHLVGFNNGVYDLEVMAFRTGTVEDKVSMTTRFDFDENYELEKFDFIDEMINGYFSTLETARWFEKHMGSLVGGGNKEEKGFFRVGNGRNGKGTLDNLLIKTLGDYYHKLPNEFFVCAKKNSGGAEPEILAMKNRRLCMTHEPEGSAKYLTSKFKTNTGNDPMSARALYSDIIEQFNPSHKTIIQTNHLPEFIDVDHGLLARLVVINYPFKYCDTNDYEPDNPLHKKVDQNLETKLTGNENAFMHYLLHWYGVYLSEGLDDLSPEITDSIKSYRKETDSVKTFIEEALIKTEDENDRIASSELFMHHNSWAKQRLTKQAFSKRIKSNEIDLRQMRIEGVQAMCISGYKWNDDFKKEIQRDSNDFVNDD